MSAIRARAVSLARIRDAYTNQRPDAATHGGWSVTCLTGACSQRNGRHPRLHGTDDLQAAHHDPPQRTRMSRSRPRRRTPGRHRPSVPPRTRPACRTRFCIPRDDVRMELLWPTSLPARRMPVQGERLGLSGPTSAARARDGIVWAYFRSTDPQPQRRSPPRCPSTRATQRSPVDGEPLASLGPLHRPRHPSASGLSEWRVITKQPRVLSVLRSGDARVVPSRSRRR